MNTIKDTALTLMQLLENTGAEFEDFELAQSIIEETLNKTNPIQERPNVEHKHTQGEWTVSAGLEIRKKNGVPIILAKVYEHLPSNQSKEEAEANARLISKTPALLQIAEMFFDYMTNNLDKFRGSLPYSITGYVLNEINPKK